MNEEPQIFNRVVFNSPVMSWDKPIEQEILEFVKLMEEKMDYVATNGQKGVRKGAENYRDAYATVRKHIEKEISLRSKLRRI